MIETLLPAYETGEAGEFFRARGLHGFDGLLAYWREHNAICEGAIEMLEFADARRRSSRWRLVLASDGDRALSLGLALVAEPSPSPAELGRWVGRYRVAWKGEVRECAVSVEDGRLIIDGLLWPANRLRWTGENVFDAESCPLEVVFESAAEGGVGSLSVRGPSCATP